MNYMLSGVYLETHTRQSTYKTQTRRST